jgi:REP element-mobilizing transposase RayT
MARPLRIEYPGALYHVTARGNARDWIYLDDEDRQVFTDLLGEVVGGFNWLLHAYCLMGNHYHLLVETPDANLGRGMRQLNGVYTQRFNRRHGRVGHVFQGRYKAILVEKDSYLLELARYVVLNPVRAGLVAEPGEWPWSSYCATAGLDGCPPWLERGWLLNAFTSQQGQAQQRYRQFVAEGVGRSSPWEDLRGQLYLGSEGFAREMASEGEEEGLAEVPRAQRRPAPPALADLASEYGRDEAIARAYASGGYTLREIGEFFDLHYSRVSRIAKQAKNKT